MTTPRASSADSAQAPLFSRRIFCNRTLNLRSIRAIGYDMDYTLIHYRVDEWERRTFSHLRRKLVDQGWPVAPLRFDAEAYQRGLIIDRQLGNVLKANQFGYVKQASHGTRMLSFDEQKQVYAEIIVDLGESRFVFLNTLFSLAEASMYAQLVELLDAGSLPEVLGYTELYDRVRQSVDEAHMEGQLKAEIMAEPDRFVEPDAAVAQTLLDQQQAGKKLLLITNSEWGYTQFMMAYAFDAHLPAGMGWRDLFDLIIVQARKPEFFLRTQPAFAVVSEDGLLSPLQGVADEQRVLLGGHAGLVESRLGLGGSQILYVGDHIYGDVHVSKSLRRWRTALVLRELEEEIEALDAFQPQQQELSALMDEKSALEASYAQLRLRLQRLKLGDAADGGPKLAALEREQGGLRDRLRDLDERITPLAQAAGEIHNSCWGLPMRSGNDKSYLARQMARHADIYTSRVSNLLYATPFAYFRAPRGPLPHDLGQGTPL